MQPRQYANTDSNTAAAMIMDSITTAPVQIPRPANTDAVAVKSRPTPWAKRLGGPGTGRLVTLRWGVTTRVTSWPSGLSLGPVATRARKP